MIVNSPLGINILSIDQDACRKSEIIPLVIKEEINELTTMNDQKCMATTVITKGGMLATGINIAQAAIGAGTLGFPAAMDDAGLALGLFFTVLCFSVSVYTDRLIAVVMDQTQVMTYEEAAARTIRPWFRNVISTFIFSYYFGILVLYIIVINELLATTTNHDIFPVWFQSVWGRRCATMTVWALVMTPLSLLKYMNSLRYPSALGVVAVLLVAAAVVIHAVQNGATLSHTRMIHPNFRMILALPTIVFAFNSQALCFGIYREMKDRTPRRLTVSAIFALLWVMGIYFVVGIGGAMDLGHDAKANVLSNYAHPLAHVYLTLAFAGILLSLIVAYPLNAAPVRNTILQIAFRYDDAYEATSVHRISVALGTSSAALLVAFAVADVAIMFEILGALVGGALGFVFPAMMAIGTGKWTAAGVGWGNVVATWAVLIGGALLSLLGTAATVLSRTVGENETSAGS